MNLIYAAVIALLCGCGVYLLLSRHVVRTILGLTLVSLAVNLGILFAGRVGVSAPAIMRASETVLPADAANPLPQALILTAIVIGFALIAYVSALALQLLRARGTLDGRRIDDAEQLGSPDGHGKKTP